MTVRIAVRLTPGAKDDRIDGWEADAQGRAVLKVRVRARPVEGQANAALIALVAKALGGPKSAVTLARGATGRLKALEIEGMDEGEVRKRLSPLPEPTAPL